jgi:zinc transporter ZupT
MAVVVLSVLGLLLSIALAVSLMLMRNRTLKPSQKLAWLLLVWLVPFAGAWIAWLMLTEEISLQQRAAALDEQTHDAADGYGGGDRP